MTFTEKLRRLTAEKNKTRLAIEAGLKPQGLQIYTGRGSEPAASIALRIARALDVDFEWLVDDAADWPPPPRVAPAVIDDALRAELRQLVRDELLNLLLDGGNVRGRLAGLTRGGPVSDDRPARGAFSDHGSPGEAATAGTIA